MSKKTQPTSVNQTAIGSDNIQVVGSNNVITRITNLFAGATDQQRALRTRQAMLELVKNTWIKGVLEKSLYNEVLIELGMEERPGSVDHPWDTQVQMPNQTNHSLPTGTSMMNVFDEMNGAMLILGEPGSGKTTMLLELARDCIARAEQDDNQPIPVIFNLSSWHDPKQSIDDWLVNELRTKYNIPKKTAQNWVNNDDLQLLFDGLDEVKLEIREACLEAINDFHQKHGLTMPIAVCCRIADYEALKKKLNFSGAVILQPLTTEQIHQYFEQAGPELNGVYQLLKNDEILQELMKQPLILSIMTLAYQGKLAEASEGGKLDTIETRRRQLFDTYIQQMFERIARTKNEPFTPEQTKHRLAWLAQKMIEHNAFPYLPENMQTNWFQMKQWIYRLFNGLLGGLVFGLIGALIFGLIGSFFFEVQDTQVFRSIDELIINMANLLGAAVIIGLFSGMIVGFIGGMTLRPSKIEMVDTFTWDWKKGIKGLGIWFGVWLMIGWVDRLIGTSVIWLSGGMLNFLKHELIGVIATGLNYGLIGGLIGGLISGLTKKSISQLTYPGQRIHLSIRNFLLIILFLEVVIELMMVLISVLIGMLYQLLLFGIFVGLIIGLSVGLKFGGGAAIQHYTLRLVITKNKFLPWKLIPFLDYCTERIFLRRVGGGYIFVHRLLMEHFAAMYTEDDN